MTSSLSKDFVYVRSISDRDHFLTTIRGEKQELVVIKFYAPWCRACRGLEKKYEQLAKEYSRKRVHFYEMSHTELTGCEGGGAFLKDLGVNVLPLVHVYASGERVEAFPCGPRKIELLREKLEKWLSWSTRHNEYSHPEGRQIRHRPEARTAQTAPSVEANFDAARNIMERVPLLAQLNSAQLNTILHAGRVATYQAGDVLISEGDIG